MILKYVLIFILNTVPIWSYLVLPFDKSLLDEPQTPLNLEGAGERLILTEYIESGNISEALKLSSVESLLKGRNIVSNSGFLTVDKNHNSNLFFWFFRQSSDQWQEAPLVLWLQGGPGCTSMYGLFEENGPFTVTESGLELRNLSWTNNYNVLYIDQPVGSGFSFTNPEGYISTQEQVADHLFEALTQFFQLFPELKKNDFYISGESYAGKYIPAISYKIHTLKQAGQSDINLKGLFMISAYTNGLQNSFSNFCFYHGLIDSQIKAILEKLERKVESFINSKSWFGAVYETQTMLTEVKESSNASLYDFTKSFEDKENYIGFLQKAAIRKRIHVGNADFSRCSNSVSLYFIEDRAKSVVPWIEKLIEHYPVAFVGGQYDVIVGYPLVLNVMQNLTWSGASNYSQAQRKKFTSDGKVVGYIKSAGNLKDFLMRGAGHMVPKDQPQATIDLLDKFINDEL